MANVLTWNQLLHASTEVFASVVLLIPTVSLLLRYRVASIYDRKLLRVLFTAIAMLLCNAVGWLTNPKLGNANFWMIRFLAFFEYSFAVLMATFFLGYVSCYTHQEHTPPVKVRRLMQIIAAAGILFWLVLLPTNLIYEINTTGEYFGPLYLAAQVPTLAAMLINAGTVIKNRKSLGRAMLASFLAYALYPFISLIPIMSYRASVSEIGAAFCVFFTYCIVHVSQSERNAAREIEMMQVRSRIHFNRLQPKLIFSALDSIYCLCDEEPELAQNAVSDFADYLRINIDTMQLTEQVPFETERSHTEKYISLEKLRYEKRLQVVWDMQDKKSFRIPMLTLQPLVQNAIEHGINMRKAGGTITISSRERSRYHEITVRDDGVGFDPKLTASEDEYQNPLGLRGIHSRLSAFCNGRLRIHSTPGEGTVATIQIPKGDQKS